MLLAVYSRSLFDTSFGSIVDAFFAQFWLHFGSQGVPGDPWGPFVPHLCPRTPQNQILGSFLVAFGSLFGALLGSILGPGGPAEPPGDRFSQVLGACGGLSVWTSIWDAKNSPKLVYSCAAGVPEV